MGAIASQITSLTIVYSTVYPKKTSKLRVTGICEGNSPGTGEFPAQMASNAENVSVWWRHHGIAAQWCNMALEIWVTFSSDNGLSPVRRQAIIWTMSDILSIKLPGTISNEILIKV